MSWMDWKISQPIWSKGLLLVTEKSQNKNSRQYFNLLSLQKNENGKL